MHRRKIGYLPRKISIVGAQLEQHCYLLNVQGCSVGGEGGLSRIMKLVIIKADAGSEGKQQWQFANTKV